MSVRKIKTIRTKTERISIRLHFCSRDYNSNTLQYANRLDYGQQVFGENEIRTD
ncbi:MAG: DUF1661 domain-containing protein [Bacteroidetes bacterium]|nr:DUF1661 domain-containing protein [Bacteroidota bacterium]